MDNKGADWGLHMQEQNGVSVQNWNPKAGEAVELEEAAQSSEEMSTSLFCGFWVSHLPSLSFTHL